VPYIARQKQKKKECEQVVLRSLSLPERKLECRDFYGFWFKVSIWYVLDDVAHTSYPSILQVISMGGLVGTWMTLDAVFPCENEFTLPAAGGG
jgi:hypothetical protein